MPLQNATYSATLPIGEGMCMNGGIYTDQRCVVCNAILKDTGSVVKLFRNYGEAFRFLTGVRYETDRKTFDARDYRRDNPLSFSNASQRYGDHRKPDIRPTSYRSMGNHFEKARRYFGDRNIKDLKYADFEDFLKTLTVLIAGSVIAAIVGWGAILMGVR